MVFIMVPPRKDGRKSTRREDVVGLFVAAAIALGFAIFVVFLGPKSGDPPPPIVKWVLVGIGVIFAIVGFFSWLHHESGGNEEQQDNNSNEEQ